MKYLKAIENSQLIAVCSVYNLFRIQHLSRERNADSTYIYKATLYRNYCTLRVTWLSASEKPDLGYGVLVRAEWLTKQVFLEGTNIINDLVSVSTLNDEESLEDTVLPRWILDGFALGAFMSMVASLPSEYRKLINQVMANHYVFYHFLKTPRALSGNFKHLGGNLEQTLLQLRFLMSDRVSERLARPEEQLIAAVILIGLGHYNQFEYDHRSQCYVKLKGKMKHCPKTEAVELIKNARKKLNMENRLSIDRLVSVILHENLQY